MKKGQLQALEPILAVIIIAIILVIGFIYVVKISTNESVQDEMLSAENEDTATLTMLSAMPELACASDIKEKNCIDLEKAKLFSQLLKTPSGRSYYASLFGKRDIIITYFDIEKKQENTIVLFDYEAQGASIGSRTYFTAHDAATKNMHFAILSIKRFS